MSKKIRTENYKGYEINLYKAKGGDYTASARNDNRKKHYYLQSNFYEKSGFAMREIKELVDHFSQQPDAEQTGE